MSTFNFCEPELVPCARACSPLAAHSMISYTLPPLRRRLYWIDDRRKMESILNSSSSRHLKLPAVQMAEYDMCA